MKRARAPEQKAARREALLAAAAHCFMTNGHRLPSAAEVARAAGVAKGTVYLYFSTKESMFLALLGHQLRTVLDRLNTLDQHADLADQLADRLLAFVREEPSFLPLSALLQSVLEHNLDVETLRTFKRELSGALASTGAQLEQAFQLPAGMGSRALLHSYASMLGIWQFVQWPGALAGEESNPEFAPLRRDFEEELKWVLVRIWRV
ncbi:TetR family transcriptional regulator [Saccharospirillum salsuginis]|uniref:TetR family transcriptional regulator n=1 Tax=Saccharospirillum salsuginis TaxID=418750 RepID=A0A918KG68_9GAMM|nr:TetR family transcriptional regulator [Saccharospirillum salsuginis]GGX62334.1 TetR family transcriptional regulator [Saccharospirillum salsuginis]